MNTVYQTLRITQQQYDARFPTMWHSVVQLDKKGYEHIDTHYNTVCYTSANESSPMNIKYISARDDIYWFITSDGLRYQLCDDDIGEYYLEDDFIIVIDPAIPFPSSVTFDCRMVKHAYLDSIAFKPEIFKNMSDCILTQRTPGAVSYVSDTMPLHLSGYINAFITTGSTIVLEDVTLSRTSSIRAANIFITQLHFCGLTYIHNKIAIGYIHDGVIHSLHGGEMSYDCVIGYIVIH